MRVLLVLFCYIINPAVGQEKGFGVTISDKELTSFQFDNLDVFIHNAKVLGLGESTHGTHEFSVIRIELFKYLVKHHGFNTFFLEASYSSCLYIDRYIKGSKLDLYSIMVNLKIWPWQTYEMMSLIKWMREFNSKNPDSKLSFVGVDMRYNYKTTVEELSILNSQISADIVKWDSIPLDKKRKYINAIKSKPIHLSKSEEVFQYSFLLKQLEQFYESELNNRPKYFRDEKMGENILYYLREHETARGVFWAHNGHVKNKRIGFLKKKVRAGGLLKAKLKDEYLAIGLDFKVGAFNVHRPDSSSAFKIRGIGYSFGILTFNDFSEYALVAKLKVDDSTKFFLQEEIKKINSGRFMLVNYIGAKYTPKEYGKNTKANYSRYWYHKINEFDGIIYIPRSSPTHMIERRFN